jgi:hypothetical protein
VTEDICISEVARQPNKTVRNCAGKGSVMAGWICGGVDLWPQCRCQRDERN